MSEATYKEYAELIDTDKAKFVKKALDYFDGLQEPHMINLLNSYGIGRTNWQTRGIIPRFRNLTKMVVEKSGMLFNGNEPTIEIYTDATELTDDQVQTEAYIEILEKAGWIDTFINLDQVVRLTKTGCLLINYDGETDNLIFDILHRGNCEVVINPNNREIMMIVYITGEYANSRSFRVITKDVYCDFNVDNNGAVADVTEQANPFGIVPVVPFYDTQKPRMGFWVEAPKDLVSINEMYNIHLTDSEFAAKWEKYPTLFTNLTPSSNARNVETYNSDTTSPSTRAVLGFGNGTASAGNVGGPDRMIQMDGQGVDNPFIDYKSPHVDLKALDEVFNQWVRDFAYDWSVRVKTSGDGTATSGFQLVVEEIDNLELRKQRQRMFEAGMEKMYETIRTIWNATHGQVFTQESVSCVEFADPILPVDAKAQEETWTIRITEGRASLVDYFMETKGYTRTDAENKVREIAEYKALFTEPTPETLTVPGSQEKTDSTLLPDAIVDAPDNITD